MKTYTPDELKKILELHRKWVYGEDAGIRADLSGSDLSGSDLSDSNLRGSDLSGSDLSGSDLSGSDLSGSDLSGSNLSGSNLSGSDLRGSDYMDVKILKLSLFDGLYDYQCGIVITEDKQVMIKLGCYLRSMNDWKIDFWNNNNEFPNNSSAKSENRLNAYKFLLSYIEINYHEYLSKEEIK